MKKLSGFVTKEKADELIRNHNGWMEQKVIHFGIEKNIYKCILWGNYFLETDCYGNKSYNRVVRDEFTFETESILKLWKQKK